MPTSKVLATNLPDHSALHARFSKGDFLDCYVVEASSSPRDAANVITSFPGWAKVLVQIRKLITEPFGLSNTGPDAPDKVGIFPVEQESESELIAGFNDKHLDFRVSVLSENGKVFLSTWVHPHNIGGRLYLGLIMPFHIMIARDALARVAA